MFPDQAAVSGTVPSALGRFLGLWRGIVDGLFAVGEVAVGEIIEFFVWCCFHGYEAIVGCGEGA